MTLKHARTCTLIAWLLPFIALLVSGPANNQLKLLASSHLTEQPGLANWLSVGGGMEIIYAVTIAVIFIILIFLGTMAKREGFRARMILTAIHCVLAIVALGIFYFGLIYISVAYNYPIL